MFTVMSRVRGGYRREGVRGWLMEVGAGGGAASSHSKGSFLLKNGTAEQAGVDPSRRRGWPRVVEWGCAGSWWGARESNPLPLPIATWVGPVPK